MITAKPLSDKDALDISYGEVFMPETISFRTGKPIIGGLHCERIFGPVKNLSCSCGLLRGFSNVGKICESCNVEVATLRERSKRMGHIALPCPVISPLGKQVMTGILKAPYRKYKSFLNSDIYVIVKKNDSGEFLIRTDKLIHELDNEGESTSEHYEGAFRVSLSYLILEEYEEYSDNNEIIKLGAGSISLYNFVCMLDTDLMIKYTTHPKITELKRYKEFNVSLKDYFIQKLLVIPPFQRPAFKSNGSGKSSIDVRNELYLRILRKCKRLEMIFEYYKEDNKENDYVIFKEISLIQKDVEELFLGGAVDINGNNMKGVIDSLKAKGGLIRQNLLGKRVDFSGRSVITAGPTLPFDTLGVPRKMAYELFKPFILNHLMMNVFNKSFYKSKKSYDECSSEANYALDEVVKHNRIIMNRAPTLHRYGVLAFKINLIDGKAILVPPLICTPFNADFDGDQVALHVPLSNQVKWEAMHLLNPKNNIISSMDSSPLISHSHEMIIGLSHMTDFEDLDSVPTIVENNIKRVKLLEERGLIKINTKILFGTRKTGRIETCLGRLILEDLFKLKITSPLNKKSIRTLISDSFDILSKEELFKVMVESCRLGFKYSTISGLSVGMNDFKVVGSKKEKFKKAQENENYQLKRFNDNEIKEDERYEKTVRGWNTAIEEMRTEFIETFPRHNPLLLMYVTGSRVSMQQISQLAVAKGLFTNVDNSVNDHPIENSLSEGLSCSEYFRSCSGSRKSLADKVFVTPESGYLTRQLVTSSRDLTIVQLDCKTEAYVELPRNLLGGRFSIEEGLLDKSEETYLVKVRSPVTCEGKEGLCVKCVGINPATRKISEINTPVGVIAAHSLSEPSTQLCLSGDIEVLDKELNKVKIKDYIEKLRNKEECYTFCCSPSGEVSVTKIVDAFSNRREKIKTRIILSNDNFVDCTTDHPILMKNGAYKNAEDLVIGDFLMSMNKVGVSIRVIWVENIILDEFEDFYDITVESKFHNFLLASEIFVSNSMRTFHFGGAASIKDKEMMTTSSHSGKVSIYEVGNNRPYNIIEIDTYKYIVHKDAELLVEDGSSITSGDIIAYHAEDELSNDISGGLPKIKAAFNLHIPKTPAIHSTREGIVSFSEGKWKHKDIPNPMVSILIDNECVGETKFPIFVAEGEYVNKGEKLSFGQFFPKYFWSKTYDLSLLTRLFVKEIHDLYVSEGINPNSIHIEILLRSMTEIVKTNEGNVSLRRYEKGEISLMGVIEVGKSYPSWIKSIGFGWVSKKLSTAISNIETTYDVNTEKLIRGDLIPIFRPKDI